MVSKSSAADLRLSAYVLIGNEPFEDCMRCKQNNLQIGIDGL